MIAQYFDPWLHKEQTSYENCFRYTPKDSLFYCTTVLGTKIFNADSVGVKFKFWILSSNESMSGAAQDPCSSKVHPTIGSLPFFYQSVKKCHHLYTTDTQVKKMPPNLSNLVKTFLRLNIRARFDHFFLTKIVFFKLLGHIVHIVWQTLTFCDYDIRQI